MNQTGLVVGVLADTPEHQEELSRLVGAAGYRVSESLLIDGLPEQFPQVDAWVVSLDLHITASEQAYERLEEDAKPIIFAEGSELENSTQPDQGSAAEQQGRRERRMAEKLHQLVCAQKTQQDDAIRVPAKKVWVLAASTGGPEAVAKFLDGLPDNLPGLAILYAQHIDASALPNLGLVVKKHCSWRVEYTETAQVIKEHTVYILSPNHQIELNDAGVLSPRFEPWSGRFKPSINQVIAKVARVYHQRGGVIVFSGMGDDGAESCALMHYRGGQVWIQEQSTCTIDSMPESVAARGLARVCGTPEELAQRFVKYHENQENTVALK